MANLSFSAALPKSSSKAPSRIVLVSGRWCRQAAASEEGRFPIRPFVGGPAAFAKATAGQETAAPCVGASRPRSSLASHHQLRARQRSGARSRLRTNLGVGVGRGVAVGVVLAVAVAVAVGVGVGVTVAVGVGVGVGEPFPEGPWIATVVGDPVLK